jgi:hypothetical protein
VLANQGSKSGAGGIRTLGTILRSYNGLANHRLQPLGHSSNRKTANRKLADLIRQIENKEEEVPDFSFKDFADK